MLGVPVTDCACMGQIARAAQLAVPEALALCANDVRPGHDRCLLNIGHRQIPGEAFERSIGKRGVETVGRCGRQNASAPYHCSLAPTGHMHSLLWAARALGRPHALACACRWLSRHHGWHVLRPRPHSRARDRHRDRGRCGLPARGRARAGQISPQQVVEAEVGCETETRGVTVADTQRAHGVRRRLRAECDAMTHRAGARYSALVRACGCGASVYARLGARMASHQLGWTAS